MALTRRLRKKARTRHYKKTRRIKNRSYKQRYGGSPKRMSNTVHPVPKYVSPIDLTKSLYTSTVRNWRPDSRTKRSKTPQAWTRGFNPDKDNLFKRLQQFETKVL